MSDDTMTSDNTESGNLTVGEATTAFEGMLSTDEESTKDNPEVAEETEVETDVEESEVEEESESEEIEEEEEEETEEESEIEEEVEEEKTFTVKASGKEEQVTIDDLIKNYQLGSDYTKKTQEIAEQRKVIEKESRAIIEARQVRDEYAQSLQQLQQQLTANTGMTSDEELMQLRENDPTEYAQKVADNTLREKQIKAVQAEQQRLAQEQQSDRAKQLQDFVQQERVKLVEAMPEFSDKAKGEQILKETRTYLKKEGFSDAEVNGVVDHRHVKLIRKADLYDRLMAGKSGAKKKVAKAPKTMKSGARVKATVTDLQKKQMKRLQQTGSARDAAAIFENLI